MKYRSYELTFWKDTNTEFGADCEKLGIYHYKFFDDLFHDMQVDLMNVFIQCDSVLIRKVIYDDVKGKTVPGDDVKGNA